MFKKECYASILRVEEEVKKKMPETRTPSDVNEGSSKQES
jgi:hypothetical protein